MKRLSLTLVVLLIMAVSAQAMPFSEARSRALFLTDKMAYELGLSSSQYDAVYEINFDYLLSLDSSGDILSTYWTRRNLDLGYVLTASQYNRYIALEYFYRPVYWHSGFKYRIYTRYTDRKKFYYGKPSVYDSYRGGHSWKNNGGKSWYKGKNFNKGNKNKGNKNKGTTVVRKGHSVVANGYSKNNNRTTTGRKTGHTTVAGGNKNTQPRATGQGNKPSRGTSGKSTSSKGNSSKGHSGNFGGKR